jgi:iron complex outermembrane receptor protein
VVNGQPNQVTRFFNAASAEVKGIEAEATAALFEGFTLRGVLGYQDAQYNEYVTPIPAGYDLASAPLDRAPKWQWTVDATYQLPIGSAHVVTFNGQANYTSRNLFSQSITSPDENTFLDARTLLNASVTFAEVDGAYYVRGMVRNITDERYRTASQVVGGLWANSQFGPPRFYGVELGVKFGGR